MPCRPCIVEGPGIHGMQEVYLFSDVVCSVYTLLTSVHMVLFYLTDAYVSDRHIQSSFHLDVRIRLP